MYTCLWQRDSSSVAGARAHTRGSRRAIVTATSPTRFAHYQKQAQFSTTLNADDVLLQPRSRRPGDRFAITMPKVIIIVIIVVIIAYVMRDILLPLCNPVVVEVVILDRVYRLVRGVYHIYHIIIQY